MQAPILKRGIDIWIVLVHSPCDVMLWKSIRRNRCFRLSGLELAKIEQFVGRNTNVFSCNAWTPVAVVTSRASIITTPI